MPLYEMIMVCRVGDSAAITALYKSLSAAILSEGGIVRALDNLGDRVLAKNYKADDG